MSQVETAWFEEATRVLAKIPNVSIDNEVAFFGDQPRIAIRVASLGGYGFIHEQSKRGRSAASRIESGELLVAAEMLQNALGTNLQEMTQAIFGKCIRPTAIHNAVASVPFSLSITTNYDSLAESAYGVPVPKLTWQNPYELLQNLRSG